MIAAHSFFAQLAPAAVFQTLRYFGTITCSPGLTGLPDIAGKLSGAPPSVDIARLLLHLSWELQGQHKSIFSFYLFANRQAFMNMNDDISPDTTGWDTAATNLLYLMKQEVNIFYENGKWDIECVAPKLKLIPEIKKLLERLKPSEPQIHISNSQNVIVGSDIQIGGSLIMADLVHQPFTGPKEVE